MSNTTKKAPKHLYLIDGSGYIFRAYFGYPKMNRPDGTLINAVYGFCAMVSKLLRQTDANFVGVIFDKARKSFRNEIYPEYKAHRDDAPEDLIPQFEIIRQACKAYNIPALDMAGYEADDLIATYAKQAEKMGAEVSIVSSDKDLMQLVNDKITMIDSMKDLIIGREQVFEKFGVYPELVIDLQSLAGDSADNIPGIPGIGVKTAAKLLNEYGDLDSLLARAGEIKQNKRRENLIEFADDARMSKQLVTLKQDVPVEYGMDFFKRREIDEIALREFLIENDFKRLLTMLDNGNGGTSHNGGNFVSSNKPVADKSSRNKTTNSTVNNIEVNGSKISYEGLLPKDIKTDYQCIQNIDSLNNWLSGVAEKGILAIDTETTGLNISNDDIVGISLSYEYGKACYIPINHGQFNSDSANKEQEPVIGKTSVIADLFGDLEQTENVDNGVNRDNKNYIPEQISIKDVVDILSPILTDPSILKVGQNIKYDMSILHKIGLSITPYDDTMLMSFCGEGGAGKYGMNDLALRYLGHECILFEDVCGKGKNKILFSDADLDKATQYASEDADITLRLHTLFKQLLVEAKTSGVYEYLERPLCPVIAKMERQGIAVDKEKLAKLSTEFGKIIVDAEEKVVSIAATFGLSNFNVSSPKQLGELLFEKMGLKGGKKTKAGAYSTNVDVLEELQGENSVIDDILTHRTYSKLKSTYTDALQNEISLKTGRIHTSFNMVGTNTGRLSSSDPNLQSIPVRREEGKQIRSCFVPALGNKLVSLDYSQIELRIVAHASGDITMIEAFRSGVDIHSATASSVFGIPIAEMTPDLRSQAKAINFGIIYGASAHGLALQIGCSRTEAKEFIENYFRKFPGIEQYMQYTKQQARDNGYVSTLFGRKISFPGMQSENHIVRSHADRQAINAPIQGSAADIIKLAMIKIDNVLKDKPDMNMLLQVHDELIFETSVNQAESLIDIVRPIMENAHKPMVDLDVELTVDGNIGDSWNEAH